MKLVDKDKIVAEIEKMKSKAHPNSDWNHGYVTSCEKILSFINTLKVKEVDLEKEIKSSMNNLYELGYYAQSLLDNPEDYEGFAKPFPKEVDDEIANFAKHFFELGLKAKGD